MAIQYQDFKNTNTGPIYSYYYLVPYYKASYVWKIEKSILGLFEVNTLSQPIQFGSIYHLICPCPIFVIHTILLCPDNSQYNPDVLK